jgi:molybdate transport system ATP-binding protein
MNGTASAGGKPEPFISVEDISLRMHGGRASKSICWEILNDQQWAVIGPNGSGKSSLVKAIGGQVPVAAGRISYHFLGNGASRDLWERGASPHDRIAYVAFAQKAVLARDSAYHQARWNRGVSQCTCPVSELLSERRVRQINPYVVVEEQPAPSNFTAKREEIVELLGMEALLTRDIQEISDGERRKVQLAMALLRSPQLLILDNPFTGLDAAFRARLTQIIGRLMEDKMLILLVTNGRDELPPGITHILRMEHGGVVAQGPKEKILRDLSARGEVDLGQMEAPGLPWAEEQEPEIRAEEDRILVHMDNVSVSYDGVQILHGINWTVQRGENWALLGPNGAGKTTLLSLILGDNPHAYANDITLFGKRRGSGESIWDIKKQIGWVAPELHLYYLKHVPCSDVVCSGFFASMGRYHRCSPQQREMARWWLQRLGMVQYLDMPFGGISEGEQRMVLIARALVKHPALLILDEPCQGLDAGNRDRVLGIVEAVGNDTDTSVIYVTHDQGALPRNISHVLKLDRGRVANRMKVDRVEERRFSYG